MKQPRKDSLSKINTTLAQCLLALLCLNPSGAWSQGEETVAQVPLFLTQSVSPNIMYILDDSVSMHFEFIPDGIMYGASVYLFPRANNIYMSTWDYPNRVPTVDDGSPYNARSRSPQINFIYYNPSVTYTPWIKADGSYFPDANPRCAWHNPTRNNTNTWKASCRNLTEDNENFNGVRWYDCQPSDTCQITAANKVFWPATYFWLSDSSSDPWLWDSYEKVEIRHGNTYSGHGRENRTDCVKKKDGSCTYDEEMQNFANWYTYYRARIGTARAGTGFAFAEQGSDIRVGFTAINKGTSNVDGESAVAIVDGVREFSGSGRETFFNSLYNRPIPYMGTPLRRPLDEVGQYFMRRDSKGPWSDTPGVASSEEQLACRRNYSILMTDGFWGGPNPSGGAADNNDGTDGNDGSPYPPHIAPNGEQYIYKAVSPFTDDRNLTLADVAMYYWKIDLRPDMPNEVSVTKTNPAFWQHMTTYGVGFGVEGVIDPKEAFAAIHTGESIEWPDPWTRGEHKIDDLLHAGVNSRGGYFSAADPVLFAKQLSATLNSIASESKSSSASVAASSRRLESDSLVFQASFDSLEWVGRIQAFSLQPNGQIDSVAWDTDQRGLPAYELRNIITSEGDAGQLLTTAIEFASDNWSSFSHEQQQILRNGGPPKEGKSLIDWLRGDRSNEGVDFRPRLRVLGDIINSDPFFSNSSDNFGYAQLAGVEGSSYDAFMSAKASRTPMLYVGGNDGMLHGFAAKTGEEKLAFIPAGVFSALPDLAELDYSHRFYVDGPVKVSDAYLGGQWKSILVAGLGAGGRSVYALDVSNPTAFSKNDFMWEFATASDASDKLGYSFSEPSVIKVKAGNKWVVIFGNGYQSGDTGKVFILDAATGQLIKAIDTGVGGVKSGLSTAVPVDVNGDRITDYVYAGDLGGNLWKFDLSGDSIANWGVAYNTGGVPTPLFKAVDDDGNSQPITARPTVGRHKDGGYMVYFGTGRYIMESDSHASSSPQVQSFYGIRDNGAVVAKSSLLEQTIIYEGRATLGSGAETEDPIRVVSNNGAGSRPQNGWYLDLISPVNGVEGERSVSRPLLRDGRIIFTTIIPNESLCGVGGRSWLMEIDAETGGRIEQPVLDANGDGIVDENDMVLIDGVYYPISGMGYEEMIKTPGIIASGEVEYKFTSGSDGSMNVITEKGRGLGNVGRQSWRQLR
ncbi:pilus assembly protein PilY [Spongiibacter sp. KMU-158]|uniref:Pilus assembly protein PilY n=1 Tax=Spongiibacter pelagi TaxID=2760804 RepID=A0A927GVJ1_9GAMM|nr:PilC/PilY family type IV pilus protein [Spongiibacter pelagi]MBD2858721.1 pilus assembly protein PilY [Spongiibacter pelagi]